MSHTSATNNGEGTFNNCSAPIHGVAHNEEISNDGKTSHGQETSNDEVTTNDEETSDDEAIPGDEETSSDEEASDNEAISGDEETSSDEQSSNNDLSEVAIDTSGVKWVPTHGLVQEDLSDPEVRKTFRTSNHYLVVPMPDGFGQLSPAAQSRASAQACEEAAAEMAEALQQSWPPPAWFWQKYSPWSSEALSSVPDGREIVIPSFTPPQYTPGPESACSVCGTKEGEWRKTPCGHIFCRSCMCTWLDTHNSCPMCRAQLAVTELYEQR